MYQLLKSLLLPPTGLVLLILLGVLWWRRPLLGRGLVLLSALGILILSLPVVPDRLMAGLETYPALTAADLIAPQAQAIVVLGGTRRTAAPEYGGEDLGALTLERVRYAAWLQRRTGLPLIVSGGPADEQPPLGQLMRAVLEQEFRVPVQAVEYHSRDTLENAFNTASLLRGSGLRHLFLVTHAWHLPRAVAAFERAGLEVTPAPTAFVHTDDGTSTPSDFLPSARALRNSYFAIHEYLGRIWYRFRKNPVATGGVAASIL